MKRFCTILLLFAASILLHGCGYHYASVHQINSNTTNVELSQGNYQIIDQIHGEASATYVLGLGNISKTSLYEKAKAEMMKDADLVGTSKAIINTSSEEHVGMVFPFYYKRTISVSAYVIEFDK